MHFNKKYREGNRNKLIYNYLTSPTGDHDEFWSGWHNSDWLLEPNHLEQDPDDGHSQRLSVSEVPWSMLISTHPEDEDWPPLMFFHLWFWVKCLLENGLNRFFIYQKLSKFSTLLVPEQFIQEHNQINACRPWIRIYSVRFNLIVTGISNLIFFYIFLTR